MKFRKDNTQKKARRKKQKMQDKVKGALKNLTEEQRTIQFQMAWNGIAPNTKGLLGKIGKAASKKTPGIIYKQMQEDTKEWIKSFNKKYLKKELEQRIEKNLIEKAYAYGKYAKTTKHLTPKQIEQYKTISTKINLILIENKAGVFEPKSKKWLTKILLKDLVNSEVNEMQKMMQEFGLT